MWRSTCEWFGGIVPAPAPSLRLPADPILQAPPFGRLRPSISSGEASGSQPEVSSPAAFEPKRAQALIENIVGHRVGGCFWAPPIAGRGERQGLIAIAPRTRACSINMFSWVRANDIDPGSLLVSLPNKPWAREFRRAYGKRWAGMSLGPVDPWSIIQSAEFLHVDGDDVLGFLALIAGRRVHCWTSGRIAGWGLTAGETSTVPDVTMEELASAVLLVGRSYRNPFTGKSATCEEIVSILADWRRTIDANRKITHCAGIKPWKRRALARLLTWGDGAPSMSYRLPSQRVQTSADTLIAVWPSRVPETALVNGVKLVTLEDGFLRSSGLGCNLVPPSSVVVDHRGSHFAPDTASDLEVLLSEHVFTQNERTRARGLIDLLVHHGLTKYNTGKDDTIRLPHDRETVLVVGQVEDDLSFRQAGCGIAGNAEFLARVRAGEPDAYIVYKPHPDVEAGHRRGALLGADISQLADEVVLGKTLPSLLRRSHRVHVVSSLSGFEALLRGCEVVVHGQPFYAGWGLTKDLSPPPRRGRRLSLEELVAAALIFYPRYIDPVSGLPCSPEFLVERLLEKPQGKGRVGLLPRLRAFQGQARSVTRGIGLHGART